MYFSLWLKDTNSWCLFIMLRIICWITKNETALEFKRFQQSFLRVLFKQLFNWQRYNKREASLLGFDGDEYLFGIIDCIIHLLKNGHRVLSFLVWCIWSDGTTSCLVLDLEKLVDYYPLGSYKVNNMFLIQLRHHVTENSYEW